MVAIVRPITGIVRGPSSGATVPATAATGDIARATIARQAPFTVPATSGPVPDVLRTVHPAAPQSDQAPSPELVPAFNLFDLGVTFRDPLPLARKTVPAATSPQGHRKTGHRRKAALRRKTGPHVPPEIVLEEIASHGNTERDW